MNNVKYNFLENDESTENQYVEEIVEEIFEEEQHEEAQNEILSEAEKRIEQANLYQALLKHDLFGPGSARPEIIDAVKKEFKGFILSRLEILLGIKQESQKQLQVQVQNPFSEEEMSALKAIANRLNKKDLPPQPASPTVNSVPTQAPVVTKPVINTISSSSSNQSMNQQPVRKVVKKTIIHKKQLQDDTLDSVRYASGPATEQKKSKRKSTQNISSITDQDYGQTAVEDDPTLRPKPMPSQSEMDMINARQAEMNSRGASPVSGETGTAGLGAKIAATLMKS